MHRRAAYLATHRLIFRAALAAGNVFAWIIIFRLFYVSTQSIETSLAGTASLYVLSQCLTFILTPLSGMALRRGVKKVLVLGTVAVSLSFLIIAALFFANPSSDEVFSAIGAFAIMQGIYRAFYYVPYKTAAKDDASLFSILREAGIALIPALAGLALTSLENGVAILFALCSILTLIAAFFAAHIVEKHEQFDWTYGETIREFTAQKNNLAVGLFILDGMQGAVLIFIWPLAMFLLLGSFQTLGAVLTATFCVAFLGRYLVRKLLRNLRIQSPITIASIAVSTWIAKLAVASPIQILIVNIAYTSGNSTARFNIDNHLFEQSADGGHFIDEYTAIKEMGLAVGRIAACLLFIVLLLTTAESLAFMAVILVAAVTAAWSVFLANRLQKVVY